jgi:hypothetical protein
MVLLQSTQGLLISGAFNNRIRDSSKKKSAGLSIQ